MVSSLPSLYSMLLRSTTSFTNSCALLLAAAREDTRVNVNAWVRCFRSDRLVRCRIYDATLDLLKLSMLPPLSETPSVILLSLSRWHRREIYPGDTKKNDLQQRN
eukprot:m.215737 g.215737  ORF g.215737 m.215737 type:complete len:105 (+) comp39839_c1_seq16:1611-1925(+)